MRDKLPTLLLGRRILPRLRLLRPSALLPMFTILQLSTLLLLCLLRSRTPNCILHPKGCILRYRLRTFWRLERARLGEVCTLRAPGNRSSSQVCSPFQVLSRLIFPLTRATARRHGTLGCPTDRKRTVHQLSVELLFLLPFRRKLIFDDGDERECERIEPDEGPEAMYAL